MKKIIKQSIIAIALGLPVIVAGSAIASEISYSNVLHQDVDTQNSTRERDDSYLVVGEETKYKIYTPTPPSFDEDHLMTFSFDVESLDPFNEADLANDITNLEFIFEEADTTYDDDQQIEYYEFSKDGLLSYGDYFTTDLDGGSDTSARVTFKEGMSFDLGTGQGSLVDETYKYVENEMYQFRILWNENDEYTGGSESEDQYTTPTQFVYGIEAPSFSFTTYEGYEQAIIKMEIGFSDELSAYFGNGVLTNVFTELKVTWPGQQDVDFLKKLTSAKPNDHYVHWEYSEGLATFYLLVDGLEDGDPLDVNVEYQLNPSVGSTVAGNPTYTTTFNQHTYSLPTVFLSEPEVAYLTGGVGMSIDQFTDAQVDLGLTWTDNMMPTEWSSLSSLYATTNFESEAEYQNVIQGISINEISTESGVVDPASVTMKVSNIEGSEYAWSTEDGDVYSKNIYFDNLDLTKTYTVNFAVELKNPDMFGYTEDTIISSDIEFTIPKKAEEPTLELTSVELPEDTFETPDNWNTLTIGYRVNKPSDWTANLYALPVGEMFDTFELVIMDSEYTELWRQELDPKDLSTEENFIDATDLNSQQEYNFQLVGRYNETFERIFGLEIAEDNFLESNIVSSKTRTKEALPVITPDLTAHEEELNQDRPINNKFTYGFTIESPETWDFSPDAESAYNIDQMVDRFYITNVYASRDEDYEVTQDDIKLYEHEFEIDPDAELQTGEGNVNTIVVDGIGKGLEASTVYNGTLVMDLENPASDPNTGWLATDSDLVEYEFRIFTGVVDIAPLITVDASTSSTVQNTNTYNKHDATIGFTIDISPTHLSREKFEQKVQSYEITSSVYLKEDGEIIRPAETFKLEELTGYYTNEVADDVDIYDTYHEGLLEYDETTMTYSGTLDYSGLSGNTAYSVAVVNDEDPKMIEDVVDDSFEFITNKNEVLSSSQMSMTFENNDTGNQNEAQNVYDNVVFNLTTAQSDYGDALSGNLSKVEIVTAADELIASFPTGELANLNSTEGISTTLDVGLQPDTTYNLSEYYLNVVNDSFSKKGFKVSLQELTGQDTLTIGKLTTPEIDNFTIAAFTTGLRVNWDVQNLNNIDKAEVKIYSYAADQTEADAIQVGETITYDSVFDQETDENWIDYYNYTERESATNYYATMDITPLASCEANAVIHAQTETVKTAEPRIEARFTVNTSVGTEAFTVDYSWVGNDPSTTAVTSVKLEVVDNAVSTETEDVIIFSETQAINKTTGNGMFTVSNDTVLEGFEIYSNQDYDLNLTFTTVSAEYDLSTIMTNIDEYTGQVHTAEKGNNFADDFTIDYDNMTEDSFSFGYTWQEKETSATEMKNVTEHTISIYNGELATEDKLITTLDVNDNSKEGTYVPEVDHNGDGMVTLANDPAQSDIDMGGVIVGPNSKFTITSTTVYDTYFDTTRDQEYEVHTTEAVTVTYANTEIETEAQFIDNDSINVDVTLFDSTAFFINTSNTINIKVEKDGEYVGFNYDGVDVDDSGLVLETYQVNELDSLEINTETKIATFSIQLDAVYTEHGKSLYIDSGVKTQIGERTGNHYKVTNDIDQATTPWFKASEMGVLNRVTLETFDSKGDYLYELDVETNYGISEYDDVFISEQGNSQVESSDIKVINEGSKYNLNQYFEDVSDGNLYLWVDSSVVEEGTAYNDLTFLIGRYIGVDWTSINESSSSKSLLGSPKAATAKATSYFRIQGFTWIYPPMTFGEFMLWALLVLLIILLISGTGVGGYYAYRYTFSNKRWYPIVEQIAREKFAVFTDYAAQFGWTHKFQEYEDIQDKSLDELREYALKMNIPITWDMTRDKLVQVCSLLTEEEVEQFDTFIDTEVDIRNYEVLERWREDVAQEHHYWIKHKMSLLLEKGILHDDDDRLKHLHSELEYIEKEKQLHAEREEIFAEIKDLVGEALDTNIELTSEFNLDPLTQFKQEMRAKDEEERIAREEDEAIQREIEEIEFQKAEAKRLAKEAKEKAKAEKEAAKAAALAAKEEAKRAESIEVTKERLELEFKRLVVDIELFNKRAEVEVKDADEYREVNDRLTKDRIKLKKESNDFKASQKKLAELHDDHQLSFGLKTLKKVKITIAHSKLDKFSDSLEPKTKQELFDVAKEYNLTVKASWTKEQLRTNIVQQLKERGDFDD